VATLLAFLAAAPAVASAAGVRVLFDPASPGTGPFPTDFLTVADAQQKTGLRINLPLPDCEAEPSSCAETQPLNLLDGFNLQPRGAVRFSGAVELHSVQKGVYFVWLENITREEQGLRPQGYATQINQLVYEPATHTAYFKPNEIFDQHRRYLLVVTDEVRDAAGDPVEADPAFVACVTQPGGEYCTRLAAALGTIPDAARVIAASEFTTLSATAWLESARRRLAETPPNFRRAAEGNSVSIRQPAGIRRIYGPVSRSAASESGSGGFRDLCVARLSHGKPNHSRRSDRGRNTSRGDHARHLFSRVAAANGSAAGRLSGGHFWPRPRR